MPERHLRGGSVALKDGGKPRRIEVVAGFRVASCTRRDSGRKRASPRSGRSSTRHLLLRSILNERPPAPASAISEFGARGRWHALVGAALRFARLGRALTRLQWITPDCRGVYGLCADPEGTERAISGRECRSGRIFVGSFLTQSDCPPHGELSMRLVWLRA